MLWTWLDEMKSANFLATTDYCLILFTEDLNIELKLKYSN